MSILRRAAVDCFSDSVESRPSGRVSGRGGTSGPREGQPLGADVLTVATAVIHADASSHHADHERGERAGEGAERPSGVATDGCAYESE